jgi:hypothetical protein
VTINSSDVVAVLLILLPFFLNYFLKIKATAYKAELMALIDDELHEKIEPLTDRIDSQEKTVNYQAESIRDLIKQHRKNTRHDGEACRKA